jgi:predicted transcriptional regulator
MAAIKISSKIDEKVWQQLKDVSDETNRSISGLLTEALSDYLKRRRLRVDVLKHLDDSLRDNEELGKLLAK